MIRSTSLSRRDLWVIHRPSRGLCIYPLCGNLPRKAAVARVRKNTIKCRDTVRLSDAAFGEDKWPFETGLSGWIPNI